MTREDLNEPPLAFTGTIVKVMIDVGKATEHSTDAIPRSSLPISAVRVRADLVVGCVDDMGERT